MDWIITIVAIVLAVALIEGVLADVVRIVRYEQAQNMTIDWDWVIILGAIVLAVILMVGKTLWQLHLVG